MKVCGGTSYTPGAGGNWVCSTTTDCKTGKILDETDCKFVYDDPWGDDDDDPWDGGGGDDDDPWDGGGGGDDGGDDDDDDDDDDLTICSRTVERQVEDLSGNAGTWTCIQTYYCKSGILLNQDCRFEKAKCEVTSATLAPLPLTVKPGENIILQVDLVKTGNVTDIEYEFEAYFDGGWKSLGPKSTSNTLIYPVRVVGHIIFRVTVRYTCNGNYYVIDSNAQPVLAQYCLEDFMSSYQFDMQDAWHKTVAATQADHLNHEFGFDLQFDGTGGVGTSATPPMPPPTYTLVHFSNVATCAALVNQSTTITSNPYGAQPEIGDIWTVGNYHTHPPLTYCGNQYYRTPGPSAAPYDMGRSSHYPHVVRDYDVLEVRGGHAINLPTKDYVYHAHCTTR